MNPRTALAALLLSAANAQALDTATIAAATASTDCLDYRIAGMCFWLNCHLSGCSVRTSVKVRHYIPDAVVSSYSNTGRNPWAEVAVLSPPNSSAEGGGSGTTHQANENNLAAFKNADVIGHPGSALFNQLLSSFGYSCAGSGIPFVPYLLSTLDTPGWRYNIPEVAYPESLIPGRREVGARQTLNLWGNVYPRGGFLHQPDDHKAAAVVAQRAGDIATRRGQLHVYQPLIANASNGYWPAGELIEGDEASGKWQPLAPTHASSCMVFPHGNSRTQAIDGGYAWALWRPYSCCANRGQFFLGSVDFER